MVGKSAKIGITKLCKNNEITYIGYVKLAITGSRKYHDYETLATILESLAPSATAIITGGAKGADELAARYAKANELELITIRPDYKKYYAKVAPLIRNTEIVNRADQVIAFYYETQSGGTLDTAQKARAAGKLLAEVLNDEVIQSNQQLRLL